MTKSLIAAIATAVVATPIIAMQYLEISRLKEESSEIQEKLSRAVAVSSKASGAGLRAGGKSSGQASDKNVGGSGSGDSDLANNPTSVKGILALSDPASRMRSMLAYMESMDVAEIPDAVKALREGSPGWDQEAKFFAHMLLTRWGKEDPDGAFASLKTVGLKEAGGTASSILGGLASIDPKRAIAWLEDPENQYANRPWMGHILAGTIGKEWVRQDPDAALAWANALPDSQRRGALGGILESLASSDPQQASLMVMELEPKDRGDLIGNIARSWSQRSPQEAIEWARSLEGNDRSRALGQALNGFAETNPAEAAALYDSLPEEYEGVNLGEITGAWARQAPDQAADWIVGQDEGEGKNDGMRRLMLTWTAADPEAASRWIDQQPESDSRDHGIGMLAMTTFENDPQSAITWASAMTNPEMRRNSVERGVREWIRRDPDQAREWVTSSDLLTDVERTNFLQPPAENNGQRNP